MAGERESDPPCCAYCESCVKLCDVVRCAALWCATMRSVRDFQVLSKQRDKTARHRTRHSATVLCDDAWNALLELGEVVTLALNRARDEKRVAVVRDGVTLMERHNVVETRKAAVVAHHHVPIVERDRGPIGARAPKHGRCATPRERGQVRTPSLCSKGEMHA